MPRPTPVVPPPKEEHIHDITSNPKPESRQDLPVWWQCPWCDFAVHGKPKHSNDCTHSRQKTQHIAEEHPDKDPRDPEALNTKPSEEAKAARLAAVKASRIHNLKQFVKTSHGGHKLAYVTGFTIKCCRCSYQGTKANLPKQCSSLRRGGFRNSVSNCNPHASPLCRGGLRLNIRQYGPHGVPGDGMCLFHSLSYYHGSDARRLRDRACDAMALSAGQLVWQGQLHKTWAQQDTGLGWQSYVTAIRTGRIWPGILEIHVLARVLGVILEVYVKERASYKRISRLCPDGDHAGLPVWRLDYQDGQHFEPLVPTQLPRAPDEAQAQPNSEGHTILLANVSSLAKHGKELYEVARAYAAETVLITETRLARDMNVAKIEAKRQGFCIQCSNPRPPKAGGGGPKEGGVAVLGRTAAPNVVATQCPVAPLSADAALHTIVPIRDDLSVHIITAYVPAPCEELRASLFDYAATLGDVPIVIAADFNAEVSSSRALTQAVCSGCWVDPAVMLAEAGSSVAAAVTQTPTTHRNGQPGRRVDFFMVNNMARPLIADVFVVKDLPLVNHFAVGLRLSTCTDMQYTRVQPTARYLKTPATREQTQLIDRQWTETFRAYKPEWDAAATNADVDAMWRVWTHVAETSVCTNALQKGLRPKGSIPELEGRQICAPKAESRNHQHAILAKAQLRLNRMRVILKQTSPCPVELRQLKAKFRSALQNLIELPPGFDFDDVESLQNLLTKLHVDQETLIKQRRLATWREKVTTDVATACRWVKGESNTLDMLDTPNGPTSHPQHLADELLRRSRVQFDVLPDTNKRDQFFQECQHLIQSHPCELPDINGRELRKMLTRKSKAASGLDGWGPHELAALPEQAFQNLAVLCSTVEKVGRWPHPLLYGQIVGLPKPGKPKDGHVRVRPICVLPMLVRAWSSLRYQHLHNWIQSWIPKELHGGLSKRSTVTATAPVLTAVARATADNEPVVGVSLDYTACFDRIDVKLGLELLQRLGLPDRITKPLLYLYDHMQRTCRVGAACSDFFHASMGIIQGCSMSVLMLNSIMSVWVWWVKDQLGTPQLRQAKTVLSVYLDDRNIVSQSAGVLAQILEKSRHFDQLINSELNTKKCQIYASSISDASEIQALLPGATLSNQVWTLGYNLQVESSEALQVHLQRYDKAIATAKRAAALPHNMRVKVMEATVTAQWGYGAFIMPPTPTQAHNLQTCVEHALAGRNRRGWNPALFWTVVYKGHRFIPKYIVLLQSIAFLQTVLNSGEPSLIADAEHVRQHLVRQAEGEDPGVDACSPFHVLHNSITQFAGRWSDTHLITLPSAGRDETFDLRHTDSDALKHRLREFCRKDIILHMGRPQWHVPIDIDYHTTRALLRSCTLSFLDKGILRTLLMGAMRPEIQAHQRGAARILCARCHREADTSGHRFWRCPATQHLRDSMFPAGVPHDLSVVMTRFGVAPTGADRQIAQSIQKYLIAVVRATSECSVRHRAA